MRCAVLGSPIDHSLSPVMHRAAYDELGLDWTYEAIDLDAEGLAPFLADLSAEVWRGLSLTMPLKRAALHLVDSCSEVAGAVGAVNTIVLSAGTMTGDNTDVPGVVEALRERGLGSPASARIVGAGATATSVVHALASLGLARLDIAVRDASRAEEVVRVAREAAVDVTLVPIDEPLLEKVDLLVSTVPGAALGVRSRELAESARAVFDVAYDPWPTPLVEAARRASLPVVTGIDLLAHQAAVQVALMTGREVSADLLRQAALATLDPGSAEPSAATDRPSP